MSQALSFGKQKLISFFLVFIVFDILFLPNFVLSTPVSFFLIVAFFPYVALIKRSYLYIYLMLVMIMILSNFNGASVNAEYAEENLKRLFQTLLILVVIFFNMKKLDYDYVESMLKKMLVFWIAYLVILWVVMNMSSGLYLTIMSHLAPNIMDSITENVEILRYSYMFSDPNTLGYLLVFLWIFSLFHFKRILTLQLTCAVLFCLILSTQSRGALLAVIVVTSIFLLKRLEFNTSTVKLTLVMAVFLVAFLYISQDYLVFMIEAFEQRSEIEEATGSGVGGGRYEKYLYFFENFNFYPYGVGYQLLVDGREFRPHSDLIRTVFSYGPLFLILLCWLFIPKQFETLILSIAAAFPFLINSLTDDFRLFGMFIILFMFMKNDKRRLTAQYS